MRWFIDEFESLIGSLIDWCADSVTHRLTNSLIISYCTDSLIHWNIDWFIDSLIHNRDMQWCTESSRVMHWFIHGFIDSSTHYLLVDWFTDSLIHWSIASLLHWFTDSLVHWFIDSLSLVHSIGCAWIPSCQFIGVSATICSLVDGPHHFNMSLLHIASASQELSHRPLISESHLYVPKLPPRHRPGTIW